MYYKLVDLNAGRKKWSIQRSYKKHMKLLGCNPNKGCIRKPFIKIEPEFCPPDILHMKKGIITKLINQLVEWSLQQGRENKLVQEMKSKKIPFT